MNPVNVFHLPHNYRCALYRPGEAPETFDNPEAGDPSYELPSNVEWATLPMPMPRCLFVITDRRGRVIAARADGKPIRWTDLDVVVRGVEQYNRDCASRDPDAVG